MNEIFLLETSSDISYLFNTKDLSQEEEVEDSFLFLMNGSLSQYMPVPLITLNYDKAMPSLPDNEPPVIQMSHDQSKTATQNYEFEKPSIPELPIAPTVQENIGPHNIIENNKTDNRSKPELSGLLQNTNTSTTPVDQTKPILFSPLTTEEIPVSFVNKNVNTFFLLPPLQPLPLKTTLNCADQMEKEHAIDKLISPMAYKKIETPTVLPLNTQEEATHETYKNNLISANPLNYSLTKTLYKEINQLLADPQKIVSAETLQLYIALDPERQNNNELLLPKAPAPLNFQQETDINPSLQSVLHHNSKPLHYTTIALSPKELGTVNIEITLNEQELKITLHSEQAETLKMIEESLPTLKDQLQQQDDFKQHDILLQQRLGDPKQEAWQQRKEPFIPKEITHNEEPIEKKSIFIPRYSNHQVDYYA